MHSSDLEITEEAKHSRYQRLTLSVLGSARLSRPGKSFSDASSLARGHPKSPFPKPLSPALDLALRRNSPFFGLSGGLSAGLSRCNLTFSDEFELEIIRTRHFPEGLRRALCRALCRKWRISTKGFDKVRD